MRVKGDTPTVVFPIETASRELDSKLVMASTLAARGLRAIVAHKEAAWEIGRTSRRVIWQGKNLFSDDSQDHHADRLIANASPVMFLQDEGAIFQVDGWVHNVLQKHHVDHVRKRKIDRVLMWGRKQKDVFCERAVETAPNVVVTGSPRFDLCGPSYEWMTSADTEAIRKRFGPHILVCTRFTAVAHAEGLHDPFRRKLNPRIWPDDYDPRRVADVWFSKWQRDVHDFADFVVLVKHIAITYSDRRIVLRPHPSESLKFYTHAFSAFPNIVVLREGGVMSWIRGADLVVHSDCTTGIEAVLAGRPVLNFLPASVERRDTDIEVAREAGVTAGSLAEALDGVDRLLASRQSQHAWSANARSILNNLETASIPLVLEETLAVLRESRIDSSEVSLPAKRWVRNTAKRLLGRPILPAYVQAKRGSLDFAHIEAVIEGCRASGVGGGRITYANPRYAIVEPA